MPFSSCRCQPGIAARSCGRIAASRAVSCARSFTLCFGCEDSGAHPEDRPGSAASRAAARSASAAHSGTADLTARGRFLLTCREQPRRALSARVGTSCEAEGGGIRAGWPRGLRSRGWRRKTGQGRLSQPSAANSARAGFLKVQCALQVGDRRRVHGGPWPFCVPHRAALLWRAHPLPYTGNG